MSPSSFLFREFGLYANIKDHVQDYVFAVLRADSGDV